MILEVPTEKYLWMGRSPQGAFHQTILLFSSFTQLYLSHHLAHSVRFSKCAKVISMDSHRLFSSVFDSMSIRPEGSYPILGLFQRLQLKCGCLAKSVSLEQAKSGMRLHAVSCNDIMYTTEFFFSFCALGIPHRPPHKD